MIVRRGNIRSCATTLASGDAIVPDACVPLVPGDAIGVHGLAGTPPDAISALDCVKASTLRCLTERRALLVLSDLLS
jgi:hypothetical protein